MSKLNIEKIKTTGKRKHPVLSELDNLSDRIRERAYQLFAERGFQPGDQVADWLEAERQICGPAAVLVEKDGAYALNMSMAGFDADDLVVLATPAEIVVRAAREDTAENRGDRGSMTQSSEFRRQQVLRRVELPTAIDIDRISAKLADGMLEIDVPKKAPAKAGKTAKKAAKKSAKKKAKKKAKSKAKAKAKASKAAKKKSK